MWSYCFNFFPYFRNTDDGTQTGDGNDNDNSNSNLVATIAATEAAIRIASDIIDSTLAHADDHGEQQNDNDAHNTTSTSGMQRNFYMFFSLDLFHCVTATVCSKENQ